VLAIDDLEDHAPEKASFPNYVPYDNVSVLGARCQSDPSIVEGECSDGSLMTVECRDYRPGRCVPEPDRTIRITDGKNIALR
jgi:hypothetical protein